MTIAPEKNTKIDQMEFMCVDLSQYNGHNDIGAFKWEVLVVNESWINSFLAVQNLKTQGIATIPYN